MNRTRIAAVVVLTLASSVLAVAQTPASVESPTKSDIAPARDAARPAMRSVRASVMDADARLCLEFPTNLQVILCAEKYRPDKRRA